MKRPSNTGRGGNPGRGRKASSPGKRSGGRKDLEYSGRKKDDTGRRSYRRNDEEGESKRSDRFANDDRGFKKQDRPYKAGTRPAGRDYKEGRGTGRSDDRSYDRERSFRTDRRNSSRDYDDAPGSRRSSDRFDEQEKPYKAGTRPAGRYRDDAGYGRKRSYDKDSRYNKSDRKSDYGTRGGYKREPVKDEKIRLNKYIANSGMCSRREADEFIAAGVVSVNGKIITEMGYKVSPGDEVKFHDKKLRSEKMVYVLLNKPKDFITTTDDDRDRKTVMNLIQGAGKERIYPVGRLDRATTGVLLFTNDGDLTKKLTHPSHEIKKIYQVELDKSLKPSDLEKIREGIELEDGVAEVDEIIYSGDSKKVVGLELHSGKNRIVRRIFEALDYRVVKLDRVYFAGLTKKDLPRGRWRFLTEMEVNMLKMLTAKKPKRAVN